MIESFTGENYFLSNFSHSKIEMNGLVFDNAEAAFHSFKDPARAAEFEGLNPSLAKRLGRSVRLRKDWEEVKDAIMYEVVLTKFLQNPLLKRKLIDTKGKDLIEGNYWGDRYWGVCNGVGKNMLGKILVEVREYLINNSSVS